MSISRTPPNHSPSRGLQVRDPRSRATLRLRELTFEDRDSVYYAPRGADWLWLALFAAVMLGSGLYVWQQLGFDSDVGRAVFFAALVLAILWAALIYTFKLSASVAVGPRALTLVRGPWRSELTWAEIAGLEERPQMDGRQHLRWLVAVAYDGRELRIREDMVADYPRFRGEVFERRRLWDEHGGVWGASGGGPFSAEEEVANLVTWWLVAAGLLVLPGLYFALLLPDTFLLGLALIGLAVVAALTALLTWLRRQTYVVDQRAVTARRPLGRKTLPWGEITRVERVRSRAHLLTRIGILAGRAILAPAARADGRVGSFSWSPRVREYLALRAVGGRRIRMRLHRVVAPDELLAWVEFYDHIAHHRSSAQPDHAASHLAIAAPTSPPTPPSGSERAGASSPNPRADSHGGDGATAQPAKTQSAKTQSTKTQSNTGGSGSGRPANPATAPSAPDSTAAASVPAGGSAPGSSPRVTQPILGGSGVERIDPRILAVLRDVGDLEGDAAAGTPGSAPTTRGGRSDWLNESMAEPLFPPRADAPTADGPNPEDADGRGPSSSSNS